MRHAEQFADSELELAYDPFSDDEPLRIEKSSIVRFRTICKERFLDW
jgi:hypothetical protein